jgi:hypothetical protein
MEFHCTKLPDASAAPTRPPMRAEPTVLATPWPRKAPTKFMTAASSRATRVVNARVDTEVAMALAASWNPLV